MSGTLQAEPMIVSRLVFNDGNGVPLLNGSVATYVVGTTTPKVTWQNSDMSTPNMNPVPLDADGSAIIFASGDYRIVVKDQFGALIFDGEATGLAVSQTTLPTIADLEAFNETGGAVPPSIIVGGYYEVADLGGGIFLSKPGDTTAGNGGTIVVDAAGNRWFRLMTGGEYSVRWFGAKGDNATDDTAAIQATLDALAAASPSAGGDALLTQGQYLTSATLNITSAHVGIKGAGREACLINFNKATDAIIKVAGPSPAGLIAYNDFEDFSINRIVAPADGSAQGINFSNTVWTYVNAVTSSNNVSEFATTGTANFNYNRCTATRSVNTGDTNWVGFLIDGTGGNASMFADACNALLTGDINNVGTQSSGVLLVNGNIKDTVFTNLQTANVRIGVEIDAVGSDEPVDIHFENAVNDSFYFCGFFITSGGPVAAITISDGWNSPQATGVLTYGVRVVDCRGVGISGGCQILGGPNFAVAVGVSFSGCSQCSVTDSTIQNNVSQVEVTDSVTIGASEVNIINGNRFFSLTTQQALQCVNLVNASRNCIMGNTFDGEANSVICGIRLDANSGFNNCTPNNFNPGAFVGGTTNQIINNGASNSVTLGVLT